MLSIFMRTFRIIFHLFIIFSFVNPTLQSFCLFYCDLKELRFRLFLSQRKHFLQIINLLDFSFELHFLFVLTLLICITQLLTDIRIFNTFLSYKLHFDLFQCIIILTSNRIINFIFI